MNKALEKMTKELDAAAVKAEEQRKKIAAELADCKKQIDRYDADMKEAAEAGDFNAHSAAFSGKAYYTQRAEVLENSEITAVDMTAAEYNKFGSRVAKDVVTVFADKLKATVASYESLCRQFEELETMVTDYGSVIDRANGMAGVARLGVSDRHPCAPGYHDPSRYNAVLDVYSRYIKRAADSVYELNSL